MFLARRLNDYQTLTLSVLLITWPVVCMKHIKFDHQFSLFLVTGFIFKILFDIYAYETIKCNEKNLKLKLVHEIMLHH